MSVVLPSITNTGKVFCGISANDMNRHIISWCFAHFRVVNAYFPHEIAADVSHNLNQLGEEGGKGKILIPETMLTVINYAKANCLLMLLTKLCSMVLQYIIFLSF